MPYQIFAALTKDSLTQLCQYQIKEFQFSDAQHYAAYWSLIYELAQIELERKTTGIEKLSPHHEVEAEATALLESMTIENLRQMELDISKSLKVNANYVREYSYWSVVKARAHE